MALIPCVVVVVVIDRVVAGAQRAVIVVVVVPVVPVVANQLSKKGRFSLLTSTAVSEMTDLQIT